MTKQGESTANIAEQEWANSTALKYATSGKTFSELQKNVDISKVSSFVVHNIESFNLQESSGKFTATFFDKDGSQLYSLNITVPKAGFKSDFDVSVYGFNGMFEGPIEGYKFNSGTLQDDWVREGLGITKSQLDKIKLEPGKFLQFYYPETNFTSQAHKLALVVGLDFSGSMKADEIENSVRQVEEWSIGAGLSISYLAIGIRGEKVADVVNGTAEISGQSYDGLKDGQVFNEVYDKGGKQGRNLVSCFQVREVNGNLEVWELSRQDTQNNGDQKFMKDLSASDFKKQVQYDKELGMLGGTPLWHSYQQMIEESIRLKNQGYDPPPIYVVTDAESADLNATGKRVAELDLNKEQEEVELLTQLCKANRIALSFSITSDRVKGVSSEEKENFSSVVSTAGIAAQYLYGMYQNLKEDGLGLNFTISGKLDDYGKFSFKQPDFAGDISMNSVEFKFTGQMPKSERLETAGIKTSYSDGKINLKSGSDNGYNVTSVQRDPTFVWIPEIESGMELQMIMDQSSSTEKVSAAMYSAKDKMEAGIGKKLPIYWIMPPGTGEGYENKFEDSDNYQQQLQNIYNDMASGKLKHRHFVIVGDGGDITMDRWNKDFGGFKINGKKVDADRFFGEFSKLAEKNGSKLTLLWYQTESIMEATEDEFSSSRLTERLAAQEQMKWHIRGMKDSKGGLIGNVVNMNDYKDNLTPEIAANLVLNKVLGATTKVWIPVQNSTYSVKGDVVNNFSGQKVDDFAVTGSLGEIDRK